MSATLCPTKLIWSDELALDEPLTVPPNADALDTRLQAPLRMTLELRSSNGWNRLVPAIAQGLQLPPVSTARTRNRYVVS